MHCLVPRPLSAPGSQSHVMAISLLVKNPNLRHVQCIQVAGPVLRCLGTASEFWWPPRLRDPSASQPPGHVVHDLLMLRGGCALEFPGKGILICRLRNAKEEVWAIKYLGGQGRTTGQKPDWDGRLAKPWCVTRGALQRGCPTPDCWLGLHPSAHPVPGGGLPPRGTDR